jgi:hypothetical protein
MNAFEVTLSGPKRISAETEFGAVEEARISGSKNIGYKNELAG